MTPEGYVLTEFLPEVPWARKFNTINCPAGHHFLEGRWMHAPRFSPTTSVYLGGGGKPRQYSLWAADTVLQFCNVTGDRTLDLSYSPSEPSKIEYPLIHSIP